MNRIKPFQLFLTVAITWFTITVSHAQPAVETAIGAIMAKYDAVGVSVAVVADNKIVYNHSFGFRDLKKAEPLANDDVFRIASISKSFTATALMQLVEAGKLSLDDDVGTLIDFPVRNPRFPDADAVITLRMILSHTSSINDKNGYFTLDRFNPEKNANWQKSYNDYVPGTQYEYCNLNFNLAGAILEKYAVERFDRYIPERILKPLGLYGGYNVDELDSNRFVKLYEYDKASQAFKEQNAYFSPAEKLRNYRQGYDAAVFSPTGGMKLSAADLARYMVMHMNYGEYNGLRLISEENA